MSSYSHSVLKTIHVVVYKYAKFDDARCVTPAEQEDGTKGGVLGEDEPTVAILTDSDIGARKRWLMRGRGCLCKRFPCT